MLAIPLLARGLAVGVLALVRERGSGPFAPEAQATLEGLTNLTAAAILAEQNRQEAAASTQLASSEEHQRRMTNQISAAEAGMLQAARLAAVGQLAA